MEDFFKDSNFLKKKESFEICIENQKEQEDFSSLALLENHSPGINKRKSKKSDFLIQKIEVNLSISSKKKKKRESFQMFHSMMPAILSSNKGTSLNEKDLHGIQSLKKENAKRSYVRHPSLTYSKRDKYISNFDGKSIILSKVIRPSESNDNSLIYIENNFGKLDHDLYIQSPGLKPRSKNLKESSNGKSVFAARCKKSLRKENENQEFLLTIKKTSFENGEENFGMSRKLTSSEEEAEDQNTNLEPTAVDFSPFFSSYFIFNIGFRIFSMWCSRKWNKEFINSWNRKTWSS